MINLFIVIVNQCSWYLLNKNVENVRNFINNIFHERMVKLLNCSKLDNQITYLHDQRGKIASK
jgi:hypothetical protein